MASVSGSIPNLINGVSQQPPSLRLESQCEEQINGLSDVVTGLSKRPPTELLSTLKTGDPLGTTYIDPAELAKAYVHTYKRSAVEQYAVVVVPDEITPKVYVYDKEGQLRYDAGVGSWDASGVLISSNTDSTVYLTTTDGLANFKSTSVSDRTYLVNRSVTVAKDTTIFNPARPNEALFFLKQANYNKSYEAILKVADGADENVTLSSSIPTGSASGAADTLQTSRIIAAMRDALLTNASESQFIGSVQKRHQFNDPWTNHNTISLKASLITTDTAEQEQTRVVVGGRLLSASQYTWLNSGTEIRINHIWDFVDEASYHSDRYNTYSIDISRFDPAAEAAEEEFVISPTEYTNEPVFMVSSLTTPFIASTNDDIGGSDFFAFQGTAKSFTDLPAQAMAGFTLAVIGDNNKEEDDFYVTYRGDYGSGVWVETTEPGVESHLDFSTMPLGLQQNADLSFSLTEIEWSGRKAGGQVNGGTDTNPFPSFVDSTINDIFFYRNRLGILSGENIIFSEAGIYENFFRTTVRTLLDADPIDIAVSQNEVSDLLHAVPFQENLLVFSSLNQFTMSSATLLTPTEVSVNTSTRFECDLTSPPVNAGNSVFFAITNGGYSGVREYFSEGETEVKDATLVSAHIPEYIRGQITKLTASSNEDMLIAQTDDDLKTIYIYRWYNQGRERLQSSWSKWTFDTDVVDVSMNNAQIFVLFTDGRYEVLNLASPSEVITFGESGSLGGTMTVSPATLIGSFSSGIASYSWTQKGYRSTDDLIYLPDDPADIPFGSMAHSAVTPAIDEIIDLHATKYVWAISGVGGGTIYHLTLRRDPVANSFTTLIIDGVSYAAADAVETPEPGFLRWTITQSVYDNIFLGGTSEVFFDEAGTGVEDFDQAVYNTLLDHRVTLSLHENLVDLRASYDITPTTVFVDDQGLIVGVGDTDAVLNEVLAELVGEHTENGVTQPNYVYAGEPYCLTYQLSEQVFKPAEGDPTDLGRFQIASISLNFTDSGAFDVTVDATGRDVVVTPFSPRILGGLGNIIGQVAVPAKGHQKVGVLSQASEVDITITNDSHLPSTFQSIEWEGYITFRTTRI